MNQFKASLACLALLLGATAMPALAASSAASSASEGSSTSVGSSSDSVKTSSNGSSKGTNVADGDYRVIEVAAVADRPGFARMTLQAVVDRGEDGEFFLYLPQQTVAQSGLAAGQTVAARQRPYGVEFAKGDTRQAFFLVLSDDWYRDLPSHALVL
ncbi:MAG: hypothetical protein ABI887_01620 [Burkholderiales bacterium]